MRLLMLYHLSPFPPKYGGAKRNYHLLEELARRHELTVVSNGSVEEDEGFRRHFGDQIKDIVFVNNRRPKWLNAGIVILNALAGRSTARLYASEAMQVAVDAVLATRKVDAIFCSVLHLGYLNFPAGIPLVGNTQNVEYDNAHRAFRETRGLVKRLFYYLEYRALRSEETTIARKFSMILPTSERDRELFARDLADLPMTVIENGVDMNYFRPRPEPPQPRSMVFTGAMNYYPNDHGIRYFMEKVYPLIAARVPDVKLWIVGTNPAPDLYKYQSDNVTITGYVEDVREYMAKAQVFVMPLLIGGGTRIKALEALSMKKPIVSTSIGCEGLPLVHNQSILIADTPTDFADMVIRLFEDPLRGEQLAEAGYETVAARYRWESIAARLEGAVEGAVGPPRPVARKPAAPARTPGPGLGNPRKIRVLLYHRVVRDGEVEDEFSIRSTVFRRQLEFLDRSGFTAITFEDYRLYLAGELNLPRRPVVISFDDGYSETHENAFPIMRDMGMPGVVFVVADQRLRTNQWDASRGHASVRLLDERQILELDRGGFEIGSHSLTHAALTQVDRDRAWEEIHRSRMLLEIMLNKPVRSFSYPFGLLSEGLKRLVGEAGYDVACAAWSGPARLTSDTLEVRRILVRGHGGVTGLALQLLFPYTLYRWIWWRIKTMFSSRPGLRI